MAGQVGTVGFHELKIDGYGIEVKTGNPIRKISGTLCYDFTLQETKTLVGTDLVSINLDDVIPFEYRGKPHEK